ncbi:MULTISPECIES: hypothetical protein [Haloarculaceae]|uniref:Uncharacterized protein n=2 Tax=Haloarculaceae TaxID=1963268 RepID=A0A4D6H7Y2_9EURY|nr:MULTISPECIES: hypothetical protein [Haloarculaceae]QCC49933.1 hypothetical protein DV733_01265 [Halapricum salinum]
MYQIISEDPPRTDPTTWLAFGDLDQTPVDAGWIHPYQRGRASIQIQECELTQAFDTQAFLVNVDELDPILDADPDTDMGDIEFRPMRYGRRRESLDDPMEPYWEEDLTREINGIPVSRFIMNFEYEAPLIDTGFIEYHNLVETDKRQFKELESDDVAVRFNADIWRAKYGLTAESTGHSVREQRVRASFLKEYLEERGKAIVLSYMQRRTVEPSDAVSIDESVSVPVSNGTSKREFHPERMPGLGHSCWFYWTCPILPDDIPQSRESEMAEHRDHLSFRTQNGHAVTKQAVDDGSAFRETGISRPPAGPEDHDYIHFDPAVLERYRNDPRGSVEEWSEQGLTVDWLDRWMVRLYRSDNEQLVLLVDDLTSIGDTELSYWHQHNVTPGGEVPEEMVQNYVYAEPVDTFAPAQAVLNGMREADSIFQSLRGDPLFRDIPSDHHAEDLLTPVRNDRNELLQIMQDLDNVLVERVNQSAIEAITGQNAGGTKNAIFDLYEFLADTDRAAELMAPINAVHYFRNEESHDRVQSGWTEALDELDVEENTDILELYRYTFQGVADSLDELESYLQENQPRLE